MLELRPTCEHCNKPLPPDSIEARIAATSARSARPAWTRCSATSARTAAAASRRGPFALHKTGRATTISAKTPPARK